MEQNFQEIASNMEGIRKVIKHIQEDEDGKLIIPIVVDFDQTISKSHFPNVGEANEYFACSGNTKKYNVGWILHTMRCDYYLATAVDWLQGQGVELYGIGYDPHQHKWTKTNKPSALFSIDDINVGTPLIFEEGEPPRVDWLKIRELVEPILKKACQLNKKREEV